MDDTVLRLQIRKRYPDFLLEVDSTFRSGITAIFGPSGSGKTTLLSCIAGLATPDGGEIYLNGQPLFSSAQRVNLPADKRRIGYMFQENLLFPHMTVERNISYGYKLTPPAQRRVAPERLIEILELSALLDRRPKSLSGGEQQRVALARALATSPELLLLDEPLAALDLRLRGRILRYLKELHRGLGIPMVYVSHNISEVLALADMALVLVNGRALAFDHPHQVLAQPFVDALISPGSLENLLDVEVVEHLSSSGLTQVSLGEATLFIPQVDIPPGSLVSVSIRAGDIILAKEQPLHISARNVFRAKILEVHSLGSRVLVYVSTGETIIVEISPEALEKLAFQPGQEVFLVIKSSSIMVLQ